MKTTKQILEKFAEKVNVLNNSNPNFNITVAGFESIEDFFSKALDEQRDEIVEMIDEFQKEYKDMWTSVDYHNDFNKLLKKIMKL